MLRCPRLFFAGLGLQAVFARGPKASGMSSAWRNTNPPISAKISLAFQGSLESLLKCLSALVPDGSTLIQLTGEPGSVLIENPAKQGAVGLLPRADFTFLPARLLMVFRPLPGNSIRDPRDPHNLFPYISTSATIAEPLFPIDGPGDFECRDK